MEFSLPYGRGVQKAEIADARIVKVMKNRLDDFVPEQDEAALVQRSMQHPVAGPPLSQLAKGKQKVVLIASDHTRPVPSKLIVPPMLAEIRRGNPHADITILIATGCHRETSREELVAKFGEEVVANEKIVIHDSFDDAAMVSIGKLPSGGDMVLNRLAVEADLLVAEGFIEPHFFAGYSGGRKSVLPGIASYKAVYYNHNAAFIDSPYARMGELERNPIHRDMIAAAKAVHLAYIVNVVLNSKKEVVASFAGECEQAHLAGCQFLADKVAEEAVDADIVITTNNGYPLDQNMYQAVKGMCTAEATCREGGVIISLSACGDGMGGDGFYRTFRENRSAEDILHTFRQRTPEETEEDQWQSQIFARILAKHQVIFISEMPDDVVREMHMIPAKSVEQALALAEEYLQKKDASVCVIPEGIATVVLPKEG